MTPISVLFENDEILLVNKPAGLSVQGGAGISCSLDGVLSAQEGYRVHLVHRLDKDTAGLLVVAKDAAAASVWARRFAGRSVHKEYRAFCLGTPALAGKPCAAGQGGTLRGTVVAHGREQAADLRFTVLRSGLLPPDGAVPEGQEGCRLALSELSVTLGTGRMHQIRIQLAAAGAPVAADDKHGDFRLNRRLRPLGIRRLCLAAVSLSLPLEGGMRTFTAPLPDHMARARSLLEAPCP